MIKDSYLKLIRYNLEWKPDCIDIFHISPFHMVLFIFAKQLAGGVLLKMLKYFEAMLVIFGFSCVYDIIES